MAAIPAYNEERFIGSVVLSVGRYVDIVVVIDDGSSDDTAEIARAAGALVVRHGSNRGYGQAINSAFREARDLGAAALVLIDGDGQHHAAEIETVLEPVLAGEADISVGSRFLSLRSPVPTIRKLGQHALTVATNMSSGVRLTDSQSGFRAFSPQAIQRIVFEVRSWSVMSELQFQAGELGLRVAEVPITVCYEEPAKRNPIAHGLNVLHGILHLFSKRHPLVFFGVPGALNLVAAMCLAARALGSYGTTGQLRIVSLLAAALFSNIGVICLFVGLLLSAGEGTWLLARPRESEAERGPSAQPAESLVPEGRPVWPIADRSSALNG